MRPQKYNNKKTLIGNQLKYADKFEALKTLPEEFKLIRI